MTFKSNAKSMVTEEASFIDPLDLKSEIKIIKTKYDTWYHRRKNPVAKGQEVIVALKNNNMRI